MTNTQKTFDVKWTGKYPYLCGGEWIIEYDGQRLELPDDLKYNHMNTFGVYQKWHFDESWEEIWEDYCDGLQQAEWIKSNLSWLEPLFQRYEIPATSKNYEMLFSEIEDADFRAGSCGGCT